MFTHRPVSLAANVAALAAGCAFLGAEVYLPLQIQVGFGEPVWVVGAGAGADDGRLDDGSMTRLASARRSRDQILAGTSLVFGATLVMAFPVGGVVLPMVAFAFSGLGMGIARPALFSAVLADSGRARGQGDLGHPAGAAGRRGLGTAVAGIVFAASFSDAAIRAAEKAGAHVPAVVPAARHTYLAAALLGGIGVIACAWMRREPRSRFPHQSPPDRSRFGYNFPRRHDRGVLTLKPRPPSPCAPLVWDTVPEWVPSHAISQPT